MVYTSTSDGHKFVVAVLVNGHFQQELKNDTVPIPFGSEYVLRLRNKNPRRAVATIYIDGENVSGPGYVVGPNSFVDIERHHDQPTRFRFVALNSEAAIDQGKNGPNYDKQKGLIEVRFQLEREYQQPSWVLTRNSSTPWNSPSPYPTNPNYGGVRYGCNSGNMLRSRGMVTNSMSRGGEEATLGAINLAAPASSVSFGDCLNESDTASVYTLGIEEQTMGSAAPLHDGCTVEGGYSSQHFTSVSIEVESHYTTIKLFLQGYDPTEARPVTKKRIKRVDVKIVPKEEVVIEETYLERTASGKTADEISRENADLERRLEELKRNAELKKQIAELGG